MKHMCFCFFSSRSHSSKQWLQRHLRDPFVKSSAALGLRARSAFKIEDIDKHYLHLKPHSVILDLGASPGSWAQYFVHRQCSVIACDLLTMDPLPNCHFIEGNFMDSETQIELISEIQKQGGVSAIVSDMRPNTTGDRHTDHAKMMNLANSVLHFLRIHPTILRNQGSLVVKITRGGTEKEFLETTKSLGFDSSQFVKPTSSRSESSEIYVVATKYQHEQQSSNLLKPKESHTK